MISFIIPCNKRKLDRLNGLLYNINKYYGEPSKDNYEIIIAEQDFKEKFKSGQLRNLGFKKTIGDIIVFLDIDIRFKKYYDFKEILYNNKDKTIICWEYIIQVNEDKDYNITEISQKKKGKGKGGCIVFTRNKYVESCGYSNLTIGWGKEDDILSFRTNMIRLKDEDIYHFYHKDKRELWGVPKEKLGTALSRNVKIANMVRNNKIESEKDGYNQTIADFKLIEEKFKGFYKHYIFFNITVCNDYKYNEMYNEID